MRNLLDFLRDRSLIVAAATIAVLVALVAAFLLIQSDDDKDEKLASKLACERQYGVGSCVETDQLWVPADNAIPVVTLRPVATSTPRSYSAPPITPTPTPTAGPPTGRPTPTPTSKPKPKADTGDKLLFRREGASNGRTAAFTVKGNWVVRYSFANGAESGGPSCWFGVSVRETDGKDAGFDPIVERGRSGSGSVPYEGTGTYTLEIAFTCSPEDETTDPIYRLAVYD
jgi:hypothetical protein